jgi:hypothetical protein
MSDHSLGPGWWYASDGKWYPPETHPDHRQPPPAPPRRSPKGLGGIIALAVASVLLVGGMAVFLVATQDGTEQGDVTFDDDVDDDREDADLRALHDACDDGDMAACDELYFEAPIGSDEEEFGSTCGGRRDDTNGDCA